MNILTDPGRGEYNGQRGSFVSFGNGRTTQPLMSHRHCTIDRHLRMILRGFKPTSISEEKEYLPPFLVARPQREAAQRMSVGGGSSNNDAEARKREKRFPCLKSIHLLDSTPDMFELGGGGGHGKCHSWRTCWCTSRLMCIETSFWAAWATRCTERGVSLLDRHGNVVPSYPPPYGDHPDKKEEEEDDLYLIGIDEWIWMKSLGIV